MTALRPYTNDTNAHGGIGRSTEGTEEHRGKPRGALPL